MAKKSLLVEGTERSLTLLGVRSRYWGQTCQILSSVSPKRDCTPKRVNPFGTLGPRFLGTKSLGVSVGSLSQGQKGYRRNYQVGIHQRCNGISLIAFTASFVVYIGYWIWPSWGYFVLVSFFVRGTQKPPQVSYPYKASTRATVKKVVYQYLLRGTIRS